MLDPTSIREMLEQIGYEGSQLPSDPNKLNAMAQELGLVSQEGVEKMQNLQELSNEIEDTATQDIQTAKSKNSFNLKIAQEGMFSDYNTKMQVEETPEIQQIEQEEEVQIFEPPFYSGAEFALYLENIGSDPLTILSVKQSILKDSRENEENAIKKLLDDYFNPMTELKTKEQIALTIFNNLDSPDWKISDMSQEGEIMAEYTQAITETNNIIKTLAKKYAHNIKKINKSFNLQKEAQHKTQNEVILYGPSESKIDPFSRQPVSDWAIVERNKGFGFPVGDVWNIDWEAIWRGSIMDKYSRPYRDSKTGEWIGGYIQKRFEVDKNIPEQNNLQLKPGQKRKPYLPEYGNTEARLEDMRSKQDRGYEPFSEGKPFNWKEAQSKKKNT